MTIDQIKETWKEQPIETRTADSLEAIIRRKNASSRRQLNASMGIGFIAVLFGVLNFYGQYVINGDQLLVASLRALPVLAAALIHVVVIRRLAREDRARRDLTASHEAWLKKWIERLDAEVRGAGLWGLAAFFALLIAVISLTKWLDFRSGNDSLEECILVVAGLLSLLLIVAVTVWHHRKCFLIPELHRCRGMLNDLRDGNRTEVRHGTPSDA